MTKTTGTKTIIVTKTGAAGAAAAHKLLFVQPSSNAALTTIGSAHQGSTQLTMVEPLQAQPQLAPRMAGGSLAPEHAPTISTQGTTYTAPMAPSLDVSRPATLLILI